MPASPVPARPVPASPVTACPVLGARLPRAGFQLTLVTALSAVVRRTGSGGGAARLGQRSAAGRACDVRPSAAAGARRTLGADEPGDADQREDRRDIEVQPQAEEVLRGVDPDRLLEDPVAGVASHIQREQPPRLYPAVMAEPDQDRRERQIEDHLVQERRLEGAKGEVARWPVRPGDLQGPGQPGRLAEELLVEIVANPADGLRDQQCRSDRVREPPGVSSGSLDPPDPGRGPGRDAPPDAKTAGPDGEDSPPVVRDVGRSGDVEINPAADDPGRDGPDGHVADQVRVAAHGTPPAPGDDHSQGDPDHVHEAIYVDEQRSEVEPVDRRARNEAQRQAMGVDRHESRVCLTTGGSAPRVPAGTHSMPL